MSSTATSPRKWAKSNQHTRSSIIPHWDGEFYTKYLWRLYDSMTTVTGWRRKLATYALNGIQPGRMLDVGCGTGYVMDMARGRGFDVVGVDPSEGMLKKAQIKYGIEANRLKLATASKLPFADASFDFILASGSMAYVPDMAEASAEIMRVLRPGGTFRIIEHGKPNQKKHTTPFVFLFSQMSGHLLHNYEHYLSSYAKLVNHSTLGRGGYLQLFDFVKR